MGMLMPPRALIIGFVFCLGLGCSALLHAADPAPASAIAPASAQEILRTLGRDGEGLALSDDDLPDLFTLTSSGIEQDAKELVMEKPYASGRWKGGKAVMEFSRDLSYTRVGVYDKSGRRQRLYSVPRAARPAAPAAESAPTTAYYVWDDAKGAYIPLVSHGPKAAALTGVPAPFTVLSPPEPEEAPSSKPEVRPEKEGLRKTGIGRDVKQMAEEENRLAAQRREERTKKEEILPSTFEKTSGPAMGRHREYERRFIAGRNRSSSAPAHDFYIDEVDRAKKVHTIYYYARSASGVPKLVALERRPIAGFNAQYDIAKEEKGTVKLYP